MPLGGQNLACVQLSKIGSELGVQLSSDRDISGYMNFATPSQRLSIADHDGIPADGSMHMVYLHWRIRRVPDMTSDRHHLPLIGPLASGGHFGSDKLARVTMIRFPMKIRGCNVQLLDP